MTVTITISDRMAAELQDWCECERERWPKDTAYQSDLASALGQINSQLPKDYIDTLIERACLEGEASRIIESVEQG